jgi:hypothetical protein
MLILKRASKSRLSGEWSDDDYDVFDGDRHIGRIMWTQAGLAAFGEITFWTKPPLAQWAPSLAPRAATRPRIRKAAL